MLLKLLPALIFLLGCASQKQSRSGSVPPGTVRINDTLYFDKTEVANIHWREYLHYLLAIKKDTTTYTKALPDTLIWSSESYHEPLSQNYFSNPGFNSYPLVGISYDQVVEFCEWRTYMVNQRIYFKEKKIKEWKLHLKDVFAIRFIYRLPTKVEWESIASAGIDSSSKVFRRYHTKTLHTYNTKERVDSIRNKLNPHTPFMSAEMVSVVQSFYRGKYGTYNMTGNVAEMISEKGKAKGGSFFHPLDSSSVNIEQTYTKPESWLGFRCVAILVK